MLDWLVLTGQSVLEVTAGPVFTDQTIALSQVRDTLSWYPPDVERYVLAAGWQRLEQQLPFWDRPYRAIDLAVPAGLLADITDAEVARLPPGIGSVEQWADSVDVLASPGRRSALQAAYLAWTGGA